MKKLTLILIVLFATLTSYAQDSSGDLKKLFNATSFIVPSSPAFELLPDKPSEVTHVVTSQDFATNLVPLLNKDQLRQGFAFDGRPFMFMVGSLTNYQKSYLRQVAGRTVLSVGGAPIKDSPDMYVSFGGKIPLIDKGDLRANSKYISDIESAYNAALLSLGPPPLNMDANTRDARSQFASTKAGDVRDAEVKRVWNAFRVDVGGAFMYRAANAELGELSHNRNGLWIASSIPLGTQAQLLVSAKSSWIKVDSATQESGRQVAGVRGRYFGKSYKWAASAEFVYISSKYEQESTLDESWGHFAFMVEVPLPKLNSFIGIALGFDGKRREESDTQVEFRYAIYTDRLIKK